MKNNNNNNNNNNRINKCVRCGSMKILSSYPAFNCKNCGTWMILENNMYHQNKLKSVKFITKNLHHHVNIMCLENKTYINGDFVVETNLPFDICEEKLKLYLIFS